MTIHPRKLWLTLHRWIALSVGLVFLFSGLTGSLIVFRHHLDERLNARMLLTANQGTQKTIDEILAAVEAQSLPPGRIANVFFPRAGNGVYTLLFKMDGTPNPAEDVEVFVDPVTAEVLGQRRRNSGLMSQIHQLHSRLLAGHSGEILLGGVAQLMLVSLVSGLLLWWPLARRGLRIGLGIRRRMLVYDLHKSLGALSSPVLLLVTLTGVYLSLPGLVKPIVTIAFPETKLPGKVKSGTPDAGALPIGPAAAVQVAAATMPGCRPMSIELPQKPDDTYRVFVRQQGEVGELRGVGRVWVDQYSGECLATRDWNRFTVADTFFRIQLALHSGDAFGLTGRWVVFVGGLAPAILYITGFLLWCRKRKTKASFKASSDDDADRSHEFPGGQRSGIKSGD